MSWLAKEWKYRIPLSLINAGAANTLDGDWTINTDLGVYWRNSLSSMNDIRLTAADGVTILNWKQGSNTNYGNKIVEVEIDAYDFSGEAWGSNAGGAVANTAVKAYMYWGNDTDNLPTGQANSVSISAAITPNIQLAQPGSYSTPTVKCGRQRNGQLYPDAFIVKQTTEGTIVWWDLRGCMMYRSRHNERSILLEEIAWAKVTCVDGNGVDATAAMVPADTVAFSNHHIVSHALQAGANNYFYLLTLTVGTDDGMGGTRVLDYRATLKVVDLTVNNT